MTSVILLTTCPGLLSDIQQRDPNACCIDQTSAILGLKTAIMCDDTLEYIYKNAGHQYYLNMSIPRSVFQIDDVILRIVHDTKVMGPCEFLNVGHGNYFAAWGVWSLIPVTPKIFNLSEAYTAYTKAIQFTKDFSEQNKKHNNKINPS